MSLLDLIGTPRMKAPDATVTGESVASKDDLFYDIKHRTHGRIVDEINLDHIVMDDRPGGASIIAVLQKEVFPCFHADAHIRKLDVQ